jgi:hypothetical protein
VNPFQSLREYEEYIYTLKQQFLSIHRSTLIVIRRGKKSALLQGELAFAHGYRITAHERLSFDDGTVVIESYGYEIWHNAEKTAWYDSQPHPDSPELASTHPHHKHIPPDIKHHRVPAANMSFAQPNLPALIDEIAQLTAQLTAQDNQP